MKTKQARIEESIERLKQLKNETILRYTDEIDYDEDLSLYDVMMEHFVRGDLDDAFVTDVTDGMSEDEKRKLFDLVREYNGLCFAKGNVEYWLDSLENTFVADFDMIAYNILDSYNYLLNLAKHGGKRVLEQLSSLRSNDELKDVAIVEYLRNSFVSDGCLTAILLDMSDEGSVYDMFSDDQKGHLLNYPEGTLYYYGDNRLSIISPLVLGSRLYNDYHQDFSDQLIEEVDENNFGSTVSLLKDFFSDDSYDFYDSVIGLSERYRDYFRQQDIVLNNEVMEVVYDDEGNDIQEAWDNGDEFLGGGYDTPYNGQK